MDVNTALVNGKLPVRQFVDAPRFGRGRGAGQRVRCGIRRLTYKDIPAALRARKAGEAQRRLATVLSDPASTIEQREAARQQQGVLRQWTGGSLPVSELPADGDSDEGTAPEPTGSSEGTGQVVEVSDSVGVTEE